MIAPLRRRHRAVFVALAALLPIGFALALGARPRFPFDPNVRPPALRLADRGRPVRAPGLDVEFLLAAGPEAIHLEATTDPRIPDLLVYWSADADATGALPADAHLLGELPGTRPRDFPRPSAAEAGGGALHLYDLGHSAWLGAIPLTAQGATEDS